MKLSMPSNAMLASFGRHVISYAAGAATVAVGLHVLTPSQGNDIGTAINDIVSGLTTAAGGFATLASIGAALWASWRTTSKVQIAAVNSGDNGVKVVPATSPTPAVSGPLK